MMPQQFQICSRKWNACKGPHEHPKTTGLVKENGLPRFDPQGPSGESNTSLPATEHMKSIAKSLRFHAGSLCLQGLCRDPLLALRFHSGTLVFSYYAVTSAAECSCSSDFRFSHGDDNGQLMRIERAKILSIAKSVRTFAVLHSSQKFASCWRLSRSKGLLCRSGLQQFGTLWM